VLRGTTVCRSAIRKPAGETLSPTRAPPLRSTLGGTLWTVMYARCWGLDMHKKAVVACLMHRDTGQSPRDTTRTFRTMTY